jgi:hypothetical protein
MKLVWVLLSPLFPVAVPSWSTLASFFRAEMNIRSASEDASFFSSDAPLTGLTRRVVPPDLGSGEAARGHVRRLIGPLFFQVGHG